MLYYLLFLLYWFVFFPSWRSFAMGTMISLEKIAPVDNEDRAVSLFAGFFLALFWPLTLPGRFLFRLIVNKGLLKTPNELAQEEKAELEAYRKLAAEHGLPVPKVE